MQTLAPPIAQLINSLLLENGSHSLIVTLMVVLEASMSRLSNVKAAMVISHIELMRLKVQPHKVSAIQSHRLVSYMSTHTTK